MKEINEDLASIELTQAATGRPVTLFVKHVYAITYMPNMKATVVVATGGASVPVEQTKEEVVSAMLAATEQQNKRRIG